MKKECPNAFVIAEPGKCIGCKACELACFAVHNRGNGVAASAGTVDIPVMPRLYVIRTDSFTMPVQCRQCDNAPCAGVCPVRAIGEKDGSIVIDEGRCIGCKACAMACPFGAISLYKAYSGGRETTQPRLKELRNGRLERTAKVVAYKCDLCRNLATAWNTASGDPGEDAAMRRGGLDDDGGRPVPACVAVCPEQALMLVSPDSGRSGSLTGARPER